MAQDLIHAEQYWKTQAAIEAEKNFGQIYQHGKGPCNIFILDTSLSLGEEGFGQMKGASYAILDEYAKHPEIDENVAVIICGRHTKFQRYYSNQYEDIKHSLDNVEFGGSSPLTAAFLLSIATLECKAEQSHRIGDFHVHPRIIFISDGRPTDFTDFTGSYREDRPQCETERDIDHLLQVTRSIGKKNPIFCIPVGRNPNMTSLEFISAQSRGGKIVCVSEARQFAKYSHNIETASMLTFTNENDDREKILTSLACKFPERVFTELDLNDIIEICSRKSLYQPVSEQADEEEEEDDREKLFVERYPQLPRLGSRVKRGRDWIYDNRDNYGSGTVVGHLREEGWVIVEWDTGFKAHYRFGSTRKFSNKYDIQLCNEPRILGNELIATGCLVTRGKDWVCGNQDGGAGNIGTVLKVEGSGRVLVRWQHGLTNVYTFGANGRFELDVSDPFSPKAVKFLEDQMRNALLDSVGEVQADYNDGFKNTSDGTSAKKDMEFEKQVSVNRPILHVTKGKYFKNNSVVEKPASDIETDGPSFSFAVNQWCWKDCEGNWNPYSREVNERINKCYKRDPKSTVIVNIQDQSYRVVMAKNRQINQTTRDISEIKLVTNWSSP